MDPGVDVTFRPPDDPGTQVFATLTNPEGQAVAQQISSENANGVETVHMFKSNPEPGQYELTYVAANPVGGTTTSATFTGAVSLNAPAVTATGVPNSTSTKLPPGVAVTVPIKVTNTSNSTMNLFVDPRLTQTQSSSLVPLDKVTNIKLPINTATNPPLFIVPTETSLLNVSVTATLPVTFSWGCDNPDLESTIDGTQAFGQFSASYVTPGVWAIEPALLGPTTGPLSATADVALAAQLRSFDPAVTSSTSDPQLEDIDPTAPPGKTVTLTATIMPLGAPGTVVTGDLFVDDDVADDGTVNELADIPYQYTVASP